MARLGERLQPVLSDVAKRMRYDSLKAYGKNATELRQALNAPLEFEITEEIPDGEKSKYAGCTVVLSRPNAPVGGAWTVGLDKDGRASLDATIVGYIQAGLPTQLRLWNKGHDHYEDGPALTQTFKVTEKVTVIPLGSTGITPKWFEESGTTNNNERGVEMAKKKTGKNIPLPILILICAVLLFAMYLSLSTLALAIWSDSVMGTVDSYQARLDDTDAGQNALRAHPLPWSFPLRQQARRTVRI